MTHDTVKRGKCGTLTLYVNLGIEGMTWENGLKCEAHLLKASSHRSVSQIR